MKRAYFGLGSNVGDKAAMIAAATKRLEQTPGIRVVARSRNYRTPPWGDMDQDWFLNAALGVDTDLPPHALLKAALAIETDLGRVRERRWGPRLIDIDVLFYEGAEISDEQLILPHRFLRERAFVLIPLAEIAPDLIVGGENIEESLSKLNQAGITPLS